MTRTHLRRIWSRIRLFFLVFGLALALTGCEALAALAPAAVSGLSAYEKAVDDATKAKANAKDKAELLAAIEKARTEAAKRASEEAKRDAAAKAKLDALAAELAAKPCPSCPVCPTLPQAPVLPVVDAGAEGGS
jgi:hypothetical protein